MSEQPREWFWFMSLALITHQGLTFYRRTGRVTVNPGGTRFDLFHEILDSVKTETPALETAVVLAFDVQQDELEPPA